MMTPPFLRHIGTQQPSDAVHALAWPDPDSRRTHSTFTRSVVTQLLHIPRPASRAGSLFFALALALAAPAAAQGAARAKLVADLDSLARAAVLRDQVVGRSVAVVQGGDTLLLEGYGLGSLELNVPTPDDAVYEIGSVTKQFTAVAILQLVEQGKIDLDASITQYLPDYPLGGRRVTVRHLLDHTSGIKGFTELPGFSNQGMGELPRDSLVARIAAAPFTFEPGAAQIYNNSGFFLAGRIIEKVSGRPYEEYVQQEIFAPLGMRRSAYCSNREVVRNKVQGYAASRGGFVQGGFINHRWPYAAGSLCASIGDMVTWLRALHGGRILSAAMYREMTTPAKLNNGIKLRYGMGVYVGDDDAGNRMISHGGAIPGYLAEARYYPRSDLYIVVLQNTTNGPSAPEVIADALAERVLGRQLPPAQIGLRDPGRYLGAYVGPTRNRQEAVFHIERGKNGLTYREGDDQPTPLRHIGSGRFTADAPRSSWPYTPVSLQFVGDAGDTTELRVDTGFNHLVLRRQ